jgi:hypothetical protein
MAHPTSFVHPLHPKVVCLLKRDIYIYIYIYIYGLKQAPCAWFSILKTQLMVLVYVDDLILIGSFVLALDVVLKSLSAAFPIKDLGPLSFFLGVEVAMCATGLHLSQHRYVMELLKKTNMILAKPLTSPMSASSQLHKYAGISMTDATMYRNTVCALQYIAVTRTNIAFVVNKCS